MKFGYKWKQHWWSNKSMQYVILNKTLCKKYFHSGKTVKESVAINNTITNYNKTTIHNH